MLICITHSRDQPPLKYTLFQLKVYANIRPLKISKWEMCIYSTIFKTVLSSGYILILLSIENILASLIETCQGWSRMRNVK